MVTWYDKISRYGYAMTMPDIDYMGSGGVEYVLAQDHKRTHTHAHINIHANTHICTLPTNNNTQNTAQNTHTRARTQSRTHAGTHPSTHPHTHTHTYIHACMHARTYKSTPPACIKTVRFQITTNASADGYARPATSPFRIQILLRHCLQCYPRCDWLLKVNTRHVHLAVRPGRRERRRIKEYTKPTGTRAK